MTAWTLSRVRASGEGYLRELGRARLARLAGRATPSPRDIRKAWDPELGRGAIDLALEESEARSPNEVDARSGQSLLAWLVELEVSEGRAPMDDWLASWRASASVRTPDARVVPFAAIDREIARETDRGLRLQLDVARVELLERDVAGTLAERSARTRDSLEKVGIAGSARETAERLSGENLAELAGQARDALQQSADAWHDSLGARLRRDLGVPRGEARPSDVLAAVDASIFDLAFRASDRETLVRRSIDEVGLDPDVGGRLVIEKFARAEGAGAALVATEVPGAVHLVFGEHAGVEGQRNALRALGAALRLAHVEGDAPFEHRWLGDPAVGEMCGWTLAGLLIDEAWLARHAGLSRNEARRLIAITALRALHDLRRACAVHLHFMETVDAGLPAGAYRELYSEIVGSAIGVRPHGVDALLDVPSVVAPGAALRGLQGASVLFDELVERFDVDWYRNPRAGAWLVQSVLEPARGESASQMIRGATGREMSFAPTIRRLERTLAA